MKRVDAKPASTLIRSWRASPRRQTPSSRLDRPHAGNGAGAFKDRFEERGLAALERAHQCDAPRTRGSSADRQLPEWSSPMSHPLVSGSGREGRPGSDRPNGGSCCGTSRGSHGRAAGRRAQGRRLALQRARRTSALGLAADRPGQDVVVGRQGRAHRLEVLGEVLRPRSTNCAISTEARQRRKGPSATSRTPHNPMVSR